MNIKARIYEYYVGYTTTLKWIRNANRFERNKEAARTKYFSWASFIKTQDGLKRKYFPEIK